MKENDAIFIFELYQSKDFYQISKLIFFLIILNGILPGTSWLLKRKCTV